MLSTGILIGYSFLTGTGHLFNMSNKLVPVYQGHIAESTFPVILVPVNPSIGTQSTDVKPHVLAKNGLTRS